MCIRDSVRTDLDPISANMRNVLNEMVEFNKAEADDSTRQIVSIVRSAELGLSLIHI